ncbi:MAG: hypothetical protein R3E90_07280 [Marinicella sp.]
MKKLLLLASLATSYSHAQNDTCHNLIDQLFDPTIVESKNINEENLKLIADFLTSPLKSNLTLNSLSDDENSLLDASYLSLKGAGCINKTFSTPKSIWGVGVISGYIRESGTNNPIDGGWVRIYDHSGSYLGADITDSQGNYSYSGLAPGNYFARTDNTGYFDELWNNIPCPQDNCTITSGSPITVNNDNVIANFELNQGGSWLYSRIWHQ